MSGKEQSQPSGTWYTVIDGKFHTKVTEDTPGAVARKWETPDGKSGIKHELIYNALFGTIENIKFAEGEYGEQVLIYLDKDENGETPIIALSTTSKYGVDFLKRLPGVDLTKEVRIMPFSFQNDKDKEVAGVQISHKDEEGKFKVAVKNHFSDGATENAKATNGFPTPPANAKDTWVKADWKNYFGYVVPKFLSTYAKENVLTKLDGKVSPVKEEYYPEDEIRPEDIPF